MMWRWAVVLAVLLHAAVASGEIVDKWPPYTRGKDKFTWGLTLAQRENGVNFLGAGTRVRRVLHKMLKGEPIHVVAVGGSVTTGHVSIERIAWPDYVVNYLKDHYSNKINHTNAAVGGSRTPYLSVCHGLHVPTDSDLILIEYSLNDGATTRLVDNHKRAQERLVRRLLSYPNQPAIIFAHALSWTQKAEENWSETAEDAYNELSQWYHIPAASLRSCCFRELLLSKPGFNTSYRNPAGSSAEVVAARAGVSFFYDGTHLDALSGARALGELTIHMIEKVIKSLEEVPYRAEEKPDKDDDELPPTMFKNNRMTLRDRCFIGDHFLKLVKHAQGFEWINEAKGLQARYGMVAFTPGSVLRIQVDTTAPSLKTEEHVVVLISHLNSYKNMGAMDVRCVSNCTCEPRFMEGHWDKISSQPSMFRLSVTQSPECVIELIATQRNCTVSRPEGTLTVAHYPDNHTRTLQ